MGEVIVLDVITRLDLPVERVLDGAKEINLAEATIVGYTEDGEFYFSSSRANGADVLWALEKAKQELLNVSIPED